MKQLQKLILLSFSVLAMQGCYLIKEKDVYTVDGYKKANQIGALKWPAGVKGAKFSRAYDVPELPYDDSSYVENLYPPNL